MTEYMKKIIFVIALISAAFITVTVNASVYLDDFTHETRHLTLSINDEVVEGDVADGGFCFDFSGVSEGTSASRYAYQKYMTATNRLYIDFDFELINGADLRFELRNYDSNIENSSVKGSYYPFFIHNGIITFADNSVLYYGQNGGRITVDMTVDTRNIATIKVYIDSFLIKTDTVANLPLKAQTSFEYRICASAVGTSSSDSPAAIIDNLKVLTDESEIPILHTGDPEYYFDYGDNRFLKSENMFTFNRVKSSRQLANFTNKSISCESILAMYNSQESSSELISAKKENKTLAPGEVMLVEMQDNAPYPPLSTRIDSLIWQGTTPIAARKPAVQSTARAPLPDTLSLKLADAAGVHPRLLTTASEIENMSAYINEDETLAAMYDALLDWQNTHNASEFLTCAVPSYGNSTSVVSDIIYNRALVWGYLWQATGDEAYAADLVRDMLTIAQYTDWYYGKENFLLTAHIAAAMAIGYDFTYDYLCKEENLQAKAMICDAIYKNGVLPALEIYREDLYNGWHRRPDNWNMICNGGIATACMAIGDIKEYAEDCSVALNYALRLMEHPFNYFAPEGAWVEGLGYYGYMMNFGSDFIASLINTFGEDFGYTDFGGFAQSATDTIKLSGSQYIYSYSDADPKVTNQSSLLSFFGKYFNRPELGFVRQKQFRDRGAYNVKDLLWYSPSFKNPPANAGKDGYDAEYGIETDTCYTGSGVVALHDDYSANQAFAAANCGKNSDYHTHIDMGSFVYESNGEQWFVDLGLNDYSLKDCFNKQYYRLKPEGHNCVVFNPDSDSFGQIRESEGTIAAKSFGADESWFMMDISSAYVEDVSEYKRLIYLDKNTKGFAVKDKFSLNDTNNEFYWFAHTPASITLSDDGKTAILTKPNGKSLKVMLRSEGTFQIMAAERLYAPPESLGLDSDPENTGIQKLAIHREKVSGDCEITVVAVPVGTEAPLPDVSHIEF